MLDQPNMGIFMRIWVLTWMAVLFLKAWPSKPLSGFWFLSDIPVSYQGYYQDSIHLINIAKIQLCHAETVIHAIVSFRVDYCNVLFSGLPSWATRSPQLVQNTAGRILTKTRKSDHITPILSSLHWLPVQARADF